eukprot:999081-Alexandrium_andersonii.AAC.1
MVDCTSCRGSPCWGSGASTPDPRRGASWGPPEHAVFHLMYGALAPQFHSHAPTIAGRLPRWLKSQSE